MTALLPNADSSRAWANKQRGIFKFHLRQQTIRTWWATLHPHEKASGSQQTPLFSQGRELWYQRFATYAKNSRTVIIYDPVLVAVVRKNWLVCSSDLRVRSTVRSVQRATRENGLTRGLLVVPNPRARPARLIAHAVAYFEELVGKAFRAKQHGRIEHWYAKACTQDKVIDQFCRDFLRQRPTNPTVDSAFTSLRITRALIGPGQQEVLF